MVRPMRPGNVVPGLYSLSAMCSSRIEHKLTPICVIFVARASRWQAGAGVRLFRPDWFMIC